MSFVVRHKDTGRYLRAHGEWTNQLESALQFNSGLNLVNYLDRSGTREKSQNLEIVILPSRSESGAGSAM